MSSFSLDDDPNASWCSNCGWSDEQVGVNGHCTTCHILESTDDDAFRARNRLAMDVTFALMEMGAARTAKMTIKDFGTRRHDS